MDSYPCRLILFRVVLQVEQLEKEVAELQQALADKTEQEAAMLKVQIYLLFSPFFGGAEERKDNLFLSFSFLGSVQVLMWMEQEQKVTEDARISAEQEVAVQKNAVHVLQVPFFFDALEIE